MELLAPTDIVVDAANRSLIDDLDQLRAEIDKYRPLDPGTVHRIRNEVLGDQVHESNAIEGNTLTLRETQVILESGQILDVGRRRDSQEALNLGKAIDALHARLTTEGAWAEEQNLLDLHRILFTDLQDDVAGVYRAGRVLLAGAKHQPPRDPALLMRRFFELLGSRPAVHPVVLSVWAHWAIARIHPFADGNGRMARLWQDFGLFSHHYTAAIIPASQRKGYYQALEAADDGCFTDLLQLIAQSAITTAHLYVNAIRESDDALDWAAQLIAESNQRSDDRLRLEYSRWQSRMTELRDAFQRCITLLNRKASQMEFELTAYPLIDQSTWEGLRSEPYASRTWLFRIASRGPTDRYQHVFFAGKHFRLDLDETLDLRGPHVCSIVSEKHGSEESRILTVDNSRVTLREVLVVDNQFIRRRWDSANRDYVYDRDVTALTIAQDFLTDVVRHLLSP